MTRNKGKILVIRGGAIGDFVLTLPVFAALRGQFPETQIDVLGYPHIARLATEGGLADELEPIDARPLAGFFARNGQLDARLGEYFASFALILSYLYDPDKIFQDNVSRCSKAQFIAGPHRPDESRTLHATEVFLKPLEKLAIFDADPLPKLPLGAMPDTERQMPGEGAIAFHPGSGSETKNWPEGNWARLIRHLAAETDLNFLFVGGEAEGRKLGRLAALAPPGRASVALNEPLPQLASLLSKCAGFVGHDSGITHLAAAAGLKGLVLWGESNFDIWRPLHGGMKILRAPKGLAELREETVFDQVMELMERGST